MIRRRPRPWHPAAALFLALAVLAAGLLGACTERQRKNLKHLKSDIIGLKRRVVLYNCEGVPIRTWEGRFKVEIQGGYLSFIDEDGKDVKISGTVVVEEL
ncbi:hypothetical protein G3N55_09095 [Dissulfurirhabdus thermomarina]|uniref:Uncharacterized protein n=1 Tax=Dissulfurirhabdus thermomarina TaxID=1765737 RepID=A0A6N9TP09_DISTH|nr:hypothetical protein [Dissulfurirhabdus thermomarina]NDY42995.1 hypothetical protein [Dissulfurirhabdus thermomarina]NMX22713.1 hypothetical protein [Dissulfurirhabdus thermomarina]